MKISKDKKKTRFRCGGGGVDELVGCGEHSSKNGMEAALVTVTDNHVRL